MEKITLLKSNLVIFFTWNYIDTVFCSLLSHVHNFNTKLLKQKSIPYLKAMFAHKIKNPRLKFTLMVIFPYWTCALLNHFVWK